MSVKLGKAELFNAAAAAVAAAARSFFAKRSELSTRLFVFLCLLSVLLATWLTTVLPYLDKLYFE